jgi:hypothetical protein
MNIIKIASLTAMLALATLGLMGLISTHSLIMQDVRDGLLDWQGDILFFILAYGIPLVLSLAGLVGAANSLGLKMSLKLDLTVR